VYNELSGYNRAKALSEAENIYNIVKKVIKMSKEEKIPTNLASNKIAEKRISEIGRLKMRYGKAVL
jgi:leucine dehydrogenase